jgi:hypothetical protein
MRPPKYYDILFKKLDPALMEQISQTRRDNFNPTDCTPERLKETRSIHALKHYTKRNIEAQSANNSGSRVILRYD